MAFVLHIRILKPFLQQGQDFFFNIETFVRILEDSDLRLDLNLYYFVIEYNIILKKKPKTWTSVPYDAKIYNSDE